MNGGRRDPAGDSVAVLPGYQASYPNRFYEVKLTDSAEFLRELSAIHDPSQAHLFFARFGIARSNPNFWKSYDWFVQNFAKVDPVEAGVIDLNRYGNTENTTADDENAEN